MYYIDSRAVTEAIGRDARTFRALLDFGGRILSGADVGRITIEHTMSDDDTLSIGDIIARRAEIHLYGTRHVAKGESFRLYLYLLDHDGTGRARHLDLSQWTHAELAMLTHAQIAALGITKDADGAALDGYLIPFGAFVVANVRISGISTVITAYDRLAACDMPYVPSIPFPTDSGTLTEDVLTQLGITERVIPDSGAFITSDAGPLLTAEGEEFLCSDEYSFAIPDAPEGKTCREVLGYIAAMHGGNGILDRNGAYTTAFIARGGAAFDMEKLDEPEIAEADISVDGLRCILGSDAELTAGNPEGAHAVEFTCPWMTRERLLAIWDSIRHIRWRPAQVHERLADPRRDIGDLRYYSRGRDRFHIPILSLTYHFDGGLSADITAAGRLDEEV